MTKDTENPNPPGKRVFEEHIQDGFTIYSERRWRYHPAGKPKKEEYRDDHVSGDSQVKDPQREDFGQWNKLSRTISRTADPKWYDERITDGKTGEVIREVSEPLSEHQGHGSARKNK